MKTESKKLSSDVPAKTGVDAAKDVFAPKPTETALAISQSDAMALYGEMTQDSLIIPRLVVIEQMSPEFTNKQGQPGEVFIKSLNRNLGVSPFEIIVIRRTFTRMRWRKISDGGGILCRSEDGKTGVAESPAPGVKGGPGGECALCQLKEWQDVEERDERTGEKTGNMKRMPPLCDQNENFVAVLRSDLQAGEAFPFAFSANKARLKDGKTLNMLLLGLRQQGKAPFAKSFIVTPVTRGSKQVSTSTYHSLMFSIGNDNALLPVAEQNAALKIAQQFKTAKLAEDGPEPSGDQAPF